MKSTHFTPEILRPYDPRHVPLVPPDTAVTDAPFVRVCINSKWVSHVDGILDRLLYRDAWLGTDTVIDNAINQVRVLLALLGAQPTEDCDIMLQFRELEDGCGFEFSTDGGSTWNAVNLTACVGEKGDKGDTGDQGIQGIQGEKGDKGDPGDSGSCDGCQSNGAPQTNEVNDTGRKVACAVADGVSQWLFDTFSDQLDLISAYVSAGVTGFKIVNKITDAFLQFTIVGDEAADAITEFVTGSVSTGVATIRAADTTDFREHVKCQLFCLLVPTDGDFGTSFDDVISPFVAGITASETPIIAIPFTAFIRGIDISAWRTRAAINANNSGECDDCTDCPEDEITIELNIVENICHEGTLSHTTRKVGERFTFTPASQADCSGRSGQGEFDGWVTITPHATLRVTDVQNWTPGTGWQWFNPNNGGGGAPSVGAEQDTDGWAGNSTTQYTIEFEVVSVP